ncbi:UDP-N-acetylmuramoyl-tripeptide--D-alanyl-D-alanine ligase [Candidatus Peregrinibacteria bacterium]|nr:UDP-N-acetylmuramoyl-tripeptide--D-alanyl-D-alanine ligase [Candidatus Peregrinibacteria bacterium]
MQVLVFFVLIVTACLSPLLTAAHVWQLKEWRWDRLKEHLRAEGWFRQLFGVVRPLFLGLFGLIGFLGLLRDWPFYLLGVLTALFVLQLALRRQPMPVRTSKAVALTVLTLVLSIVLTWAAIVAGHAILGLVIPFIQPFLLAVSWALLLPLDRLLKRRIMQKAQEIRSQNPDLTVIGITGSVGKTTTKELLAHVLRDLHPLVTPGHVNSEMGVAQWLISNLTRNERPKILIIEMGAYRRGEIRTLCSIVQPHYGVVTFIGRQHMALFGSQEALIEAKGELIEALPPNGHAFLNGDSELCRSVRTKAKCPVTVVGTGGPADLEAFDIAETPQGIRFTVQGLAFSVPIHGTHNVTNVLLSIAVGMHLTLPLPKIAERLRSFAPPKQTFEIRSVGPVTILDDTHNASPMSFRAAIEWARTRPSERKILLTSGLIELGEDQEKIHAELGGLAASVFDAVLFTHAKRAKEFERGYGKPVTVLSRDTPKISGGALLVCIGLVPPATIRRLIA